MPASPWREFAEIEPDREYLVQLSYLPLLRYRSSLRFLDFPTMDDPPEVTAEKQRRLLGMTPAKNAPESA
jgi:hypothetical protein